VKSVFLSVVIPAYNEERNLKNGALEEVWKYLIKQDYTWEVLVVDDKSTDDTAKMIADFCYCHAGFRLLREPHRGKGGTVIAGVLAAQGEIVLFTDMDQATPLYEIEKFIPKFTVQNYDIVIASRRGRKGAPLLRKLMAYGFALLRTIVLRLPYKDTQCGFKAFKKKAAQRIFGKMKVYNDKVVAAGAAVTAGFDLEMLYVARKMNFKVAEVTVDWRHKETERINPFIDSWRGLVDLLKVRLNAIQGKYRV
jgi:glycosyltransferase involved in cell wall biosynthesis